MPAQILKMPPLGGRRNPQEQQRRDAEAARLRETRRMRGEDRKTFAQEEPGMFAGKDKKEEYQRQQEEARKRQLALAQHQARVGQARQLQGIGKGLGRMAGMMGERGKPLARTLSAMSQRGGTASPLMRSMEAMAGKERELKRRNDEERSAWKKEKGLKSKLKALAERPKKQQGVKQKQHSAFVWMAVFAVVMFKDTVDIATLDLGAILDFIVDWSLTFILWWGLGKGNINVIQNYLLPGLVESVPFLGMLPVWTATAMYIYFKSEMGGAQASSQHAAHTEAAPQELRKAA